MKQVILISGYARSGKDSLANHLKRELEIKGRDVRILKFANALKEALQLALNRIGLGHIDVFTEDPELKKIVRPLLVEFGKFARKMDKDVFVKALINDMEALFANGVQVAMISDCRYLNEAELLLSWAKSNASAHARVHITREGLSPANEEERLSIYDLNNGSPCFSERTFREGDLFGIEAWAQELVASGETPVPDWLKPINTKPESPVPGVTIEKLPYVFPAEPTTPPFRISDLVKRVETLEEDGNIMDGIVDRVSQRVDHLESFPAAELRNAMIGIKLTLERMEARIKRLEVGRA